MRAPPGTAALLAAVLAAAGGGCTPAPAPDAEGAEAVRAALSLPRYHAADLDPQVLETWRRRDAVIERVSFRGRRDQAVPALVGYWDMAAARPLPVILCMPGSPNRKEDLIQPHDLLSAWAQAGFFVLSIDRPYHGDRPGDLEAAILAKGLPRVLGEYVYDLVRALDYASTRAEADMGRVGMLGLSMGGVEALLLAAVDDRVGCVVSVAGQLSWDEVFATDAWERIFGPLPLARRLRRAAADPEQVRAAFFAEMPGLEALDAPAVAATLAPRPLLLMAGAEDPYIPPAAVRRAHTAAALAYGEAAPERLAMWIEDGVGHAFSRRMQERALAWFERWLVAGASGTHAAGR